MSSGWRVRLREGFARMQWTRGVRAGAVLLVIAGVCTAFGWPLGWASVGGFLAIIVDNGGPYRSRLANVATLLCGGVLAMLAGNVGALGVGDAVAVTAAFCFAVTFSRVLSQPLAAVSVAILVCYFAAFGSGHLPWHAVGVNVGLFLGGGAWGAALVLFLWPVDAFRPAREAVATVYRRLRELAEQLCEEPSEESRRHAHELHAKLRVELEAAQETLGATPARSPSRTVRARNLSVLLQCADLLFARTIRVSELTAGAREASGPLRRVELGRWLAASLAPVETALRTRPLDGAAAFADEGSLWVELRRKRRGVGSAGTETGGAGEDAEFEAHMAALERDCLLNLEVAYEAVRAIWTGSEPKASRAANLRSSLATEVTRETASWVETARANLTMRSLMLRHAMRLSVVAVVDVLLMRRVHVTHGYWLAMTSIIVLQPYTGHTLRRFAERVGGTVAGGIVAAVFASALPNEGSLMAVVIVFAVLSAAVYTVDYGWYCFFLTPTFVLLALPHLRDWHFALIRMGTTGIGATTAVLGMLLWRERESTELPRLLGHAAAADGAYLRAVLRFWQTCRTGAAAERNAAERVLLAPARRACGLATTEAEESVDRALLEPRLSLRRAGRHEEGLNAAALTFTTFLRRLTQSVTTLAALHGEAGTFEAVVDALAQRMERMAAALDGTAAGPLEVSAAPLATEAPSLAAQQVRRMERQVSILERAAAEIVGGGS